MTKQDLLELSHLAAGAADCLDERMIQMTPDDPWFWVGREFDVVLAGRFGVTDLRSREAEPSRGQANTNWCMTQKRALTHLAGGLRPRRTGSGL